MQDIKRLVARADAATASANEAQRAAAETKRHLDEQLAAANARARQTAERDAARVAQLQRQMIELQSAATRKSAPLGATSSTKKTTTENKENAQTGEAEQHGGAISVADARLAAALERVERLAANNRVLILELEEARTTTQAIRQQAK